MPDHPSKGKDTKQRILRIAADLFCKQGLYATTPEQIIAAAGCGKGQFYHYFKSKARLIHEVLLWYFDAIQSDTSTVPSEVHSWSELETWFEAHIEFQRRFNMTRSCLFGTTANEITAADEPIREDLALIFDAVRDNLAAFFAAAKPAVAPQVLGDFCIAAVHGAMLAGKLRRSSDCAESITRETLAHLRTLTDV